MRRVIEWGLIGAIVVACLSAYVNRHKTDYYARLFECTFYGFVIGTGPAVIRDVKSWGEEP